MIVTSQMECRVCGGDLEFATDLGSIYPSAFISLSDSSSNYEKAPLVLGECAKCGLVQLRHTVELDAMYRQYWYTSSLNKSMLSDLKDVVKDVMNNVTFEQNDVVVDIGCNDGSMLDYYPANVLKVGFDPALNLKEQAFKHCDVFVNDYFTASKYELSRTLYKVKAVTAVAMFYDLPDPVKFVKDVADILDIDGVFVIQLTDLYSMLKVNAFDNICHEHLEYYRLEDLKNILAKAHFAIQHVSYNKVNGGSIRITARKYPLLPVEVFPSEELKKALEEEALYFKLLGDKFFHINYLINLTKAKLTGFLERVSHTEDRVLIMGASTKGNTLLQLCNITNEQIKYASEVNKEKFGLKTIGSEIEIISEEAAMKKRPDYYLLLPWHFVDNILEKQKEFLDNGGKIIVPLPRFAVLNKNGGFYV